MCSGPLQPLISAFGKHSLRQQSTSVRLLFFVSLASFLNLSHRCTATSNTISCSSLVVAAINDFTQTLQLMASALSAASVHVRVVSVLVLPPSSGLSTTTTFVAPNANDNRFELSAHAQTQAQTSFRTSSTTLPSSGLVVSAASDYSLTITPSSDQGSLSLPVWVSLSAPNPNTTQTTTQTTITCLLM